MIDHILQIIEAVFSIVASVAAVWAGTKAHQVLKVVRARKGDRNEQ